MKFRLLSGVLLLAYIFLFVGCSCDHVWVDATCLSPKTCSRCAEVEGNPLGHTPAEWQETTDVIHSTVFREQRCSVCDEVTGSETESLTSLIQNGLFLFTPETFMQRLSLIAEQHAAVVSYNFVSQSTGLQAFVEFEGKQFIIQFFHADTSSFSAEEKETAELWCVSLTSVGESVAAFRHYFFMACDPSLKSADAAFDTDMAMSVAYLNAAAEGGQFGYYEQNHLLYELIYIDGGSLGMDYSMNLVNVYASDFR